MRIVVALGGNALLQRGEKPDATVQAGHIRAAAEALAPLARQHEIVIVHGNGPQVGMLAEVSENDLALTRAYPMDALVAQTQGMIGYWLAQALRNASVSKPVIALITQTIVEGSDPAFSAPSKFIGPGFPRQEAEELAATRRWEMALDGERWRRVVASPIPRRIVEEELINTLVCNGVLVICAGGGGAPVVERNGQLTGVDAVVDKDLTASLLAITIQADYLLVLTDVNGVMSDFGTPDVQLIPHLDLTQLEKMAFPAGSMGPKIRACRDFVIATGGSAAIGALPDAAMILAGMAGTTITAAAMAGTADHRGSVSIR